MYAPFFGLTQEPFSIAPDPRYLFMSEQHREALAHLLYGLGGGGGFVLLTGEIGAGKTTVCRCFLEQIPKRCNVAYIFNPKLSVIEMLQSVCDEFGISPVEPREAGQSASIKDYVDALNRFLLRTHAVGQNNVLIVDEAQLLSADVLEQLRLLTNLETHERKLLQIILIGQPELRDMLARPELEQLEQRVIARFHLDALSELETRHYIRHRLSVAGLTTALPFDADAIQRIHRLARGVPRRINLLCSRAMLGAYAVGRAQVTRRIVDKAASEVFPARSRTPAAGASRDPINPAVVASLLVAGAVIGALALAATGPWSMSPVSAGAAVASSAAMGDAMAGAAQASVGAEARGLSTAAGLGAVGAVSQAASGVTSAVAARAASSATAGGETASAARSAALSGGSPASAVASTPAPSAANLAALALTLPAASSTPPASRTDGLAELDLTPDSAEAVRALPRSEPDAWRQLAPLWKLAASEGDPCNAARREQVECFRTTTSLEQIRQLGRPGILTLRDLSDRPVYVVLIGLDDRSATLRVGNAVQRVSLRSLAAGWRGEYATFWRTPPGYNGALIDTPSSPLADWLNERLESIEPQQAGSLKARISAFQAVHGLKPDGVAGPATLMQINRAIGIDEPRLASDAAGAR